MSLNCDEGGALTGRNGKSRDAVAYIYIHSEDYPRNRMIRSQLAARNISSDTYSVEILRASYPFSISYLRRLRRILDPYSVVVLSEFQVRYAGAVMLALLGTRTSIVIDGFVGRFETVVGDWGLVRKYSTKGIMYRLVDAVSILAADIFLIDTKVRARRISQTLAAKVRRNQVIALPVGLPDWAAGVQLPAPSQPLGTDDREPLTLNLLYYGNYIPLHGVDRVLRALQAVSPRVSWRLVLIGDGDLRPGMEDLARDLGISGFCNFVDPVPEGELAGWIANSDVVLGIFGGSLKATEVIANKVWQALGCGRVVLTRRSEALSELNFLPPTQLVQVGNDPGEINVAIERLASCPVPTFPDTSYLLGRYVQAEFEVFIRAISERLARRP